jgi:hypothetical protein
MLGDLSAASHLPAILRSACCANPRPQLCFTLLAGILPAGGDWEAVLG